MKIIINSFILFILFLVFAMKLNAQYKKITGLVMKSESEEGLAGVLIHFGKQITYSDVNGVFNFNPDSSVNIIKFHLIGFEDTTVVVTQPSSESIIVRMLETTYLLNTSVITSSRFEKPISESSVSMNVIKQDLPSKLNSNSVSQLLDRVPGVQIIDGQANIRGGSGYSYGAGSRVLLVMDDLPVLVPDSGFPNWDDLPLENVGQIEIVKGAASALYGGSAMNGIIHFRSALPVSEPYTSITASAKYFMKPSTGKEWWGKDGDNTLPHIAFVNFVRRQKIKSFDYAVSGQYLKKKGYNKDEDQNIGRFHALLRKRISDKLTLSIGMNFNKGESSSFFYWKDNGLFEGDTGAASITNKLRFTIDPVITYVTSKGYQHKLISRYYYVDNSSENNQSNKSNNLYAEYQASKYFESISLHCIAGVLFNHSVTKAPLYSDTIFSHQNISSFIQLEKKFFDRLILSGGLRYENYHIAGPHILNAQEIPSDVRQDKTIYRLGANYRLAEASYFRTSIGQGFRFPTIAEKFISTKAGGIVVAPNPFLKAEYGSSFEFGFKQGIKFSQTKILIDLAVFDSKYYDMMEFVLNDQLQFQSRNIGDTHIRGFEIETQASARLNDLVIQLSGGYTYIDPVYLDFDLAGKMLPINKTEQASRAEQNARFSTSDENILKYRSRHLVRSDIELNYRKLSFGLNFNYTSNVEAIDFLFELFLKGIRDYRLQNQTGTRVYDFRISYNFDSLSLQLNLNNAFNEDYTQRPGLMDAPRNLGMRITYKL